MSISKFGGGKFNSVGLDHSGSQPFISSGDKVNKQEQLTANFDIRAAFYAHENSVEGIDVTRTDRFYVQCNHSNKGEKLLWYT